ncbi:MAG: hypothetical protein ACYCPW_10325 [Nitrososphaerales archaeon]
MYDRWDNEETARKEAGKRFHFYWQKFHWMRAHGLYFFVITTAALIALLWISGSYANIIYIAVLGSMFVWSGVQIYYAYKTRESYKRWGGFDGGGGRKAQPPPGGGQSPEIYSN